MAADDRKASLHARGRGNLSYAKGQPETMVFRAPLMYRFLYWPSVSLDRFGNFFSRRLPPLAF